MKLVLSVLLLCSLASASVTARSLSNAESFTCDTETSKPEYTELTSCKSDLTGIRYKTIIFRESVLLNGGK